MIYGWLDVRRLPTQNISRSLTEHPWISDPGIRSGPPRLLAVYIRKCRVRSEPLPVLVVTSKRIEARGITTECTVSHWLALHALDSGGRRSCLEQAVTYLIAAHRMKLRRSVPIDRAIQRKRVESRIAWKRIESTVSDRSAPVAQNRTLDFPEVSGVRVVSKQAVSSRGLKCLPRFPGVPQYYGIHSDTRAVYPFRRLLSRRPQYSPGLRHGGQTGSCS